MTNRRLIYIGVSMLVLGVVGALVVNKIVDEREERTLCQAFLSSSQEITQRFGDPVSIRYEANESGVRFFSDHIEGEYRFHILGSRQTDIVEVAWTTLLNTHTTTVVRIDIVQQQGKRIPLWRPQ